MFYSGNQCHDERKGIHVSVAGVGSVGEERETVGAVCQASRKEVKIKKSKVKKSIAGVGLMNGESL